MRAFAASADLFALAAAVKALRRRVGFEHQNAAELRRYCVAKRMASAGVNECSRIEQSTSGGKSGAVGRWTQVAIARRRAKRCDACGIYSPSTAVTQEGMRTSAS